jgi:hypothetical protein
MITLKDGAIPDVWKEATGLMWLEPSNSLCVNWVTDSRIICGPMILSINTE